jgi:hypothetical protein
LPASSVKITFIPSVVMSVMPATMGAAAEVESGPRWWLIEAATSSAVRIWPEWNCTPSRMLKVQTVASGVASQPVASSGTSEPSAAISVRKLLRVCAWKIMNSASQEPGSSASVLPPVAMATRSVPPRAAGRAAACPMASRGPRPRLRSRP